MNNSICVIFPYRYNNFWVFDDFQAGLYREPFVLGVPEIINYILERYFGPPIVKNIHDFCSKFTLLFSQNTFPGSWIQLNWLKEEQGGNWYELDGAGMIGWLCPALFLYFNKAPKNIYCSVKV